VGGSFDPLAEDNTWGKRGEGIVRVPSYLLLHQEEGREDVGGAGPPVSGGGGNTLGVGGVGLSAGGGGTRGAESTTRSGATSPRAGGSPQPPDDAGNVSNSARSRDTFPVTDNQKKDEVQSKGSNQSNRRGEEPEESRGRRQSGARKQEEDGRPKDSSRPRESIEKDGPVRRGSKRGSAQPKDSERPGESVQKERQPRESLQKERQANESVQRGSAVPSESVKGESTVPTESIQRDKAISRKDSVQRSGTHEESHEAQETKLAFKGRMSLSAKEEDRMLEQANEDFTDEEYQVCGLTSDKFCFSFPIV